MTKKELEVVKPEKVEKPKKKTTTNGNSTSKNGKKKKILKTLALISGIITCIDFIIIDFVPFVDEALLTAITGVLAVIAAYIKDE
jgi:hypothetical protein